MSNMTQHAPDPQEVSSVRELEIPGGFMTTRNAAKFLGTSSGYLYGKLYLEYHRIIPYARMAGRLFWAVNDLKDYKRTHDRLGEISTDPALRQAASQRAHTAAASRKRTVTNAPEVVA
jgi:hypothetical protein